MYNVHIHVYMHMYLRMYCLPQLFTVVRNVKQAHECLELGESQQFFDEMEYLMDSLQPQQPLSVRCLG